MARSRLEQVISDAILDFEQYGFDDEQRLADWERKIREAIALEYSQQEQFSNQFREHMKAIFDRLVTRGGVLRAHPGVERFTLAHVAARLHSELDRRILASVQLIRLNRVEAIEKTLRRFSGWATSIPAGGSEQVDRRQVRREISAPISKLPFVERRVLIDQGHKLNSAISATLAHDAGAIAATWFSHFRQSGYDYREDHRLRDGHTYLIRDSWAHKAGLVKVSKDGYSDSITQPAEEPFCFPGNSEIQSAHIVEKAYRRWFSGELTEIVTSTNKTLRATLNHPVLTKSGWQAIGSLNFGDEVIEIADERFFTASKNKKNGGVTSIQDVFETVKKFGVVETLDLHPAAFHGDGSDGYVDTVTAARGLHVSVQTGQIQSIRKFPFSMADYKTSFIRDVCASLFRVCDATQSVMGRFSYFLSSVCAYPLHPQGASVGTASRNSTSFNQTFNYSSTTSAHAVGDRENTFPGVKSVGYFGRVQKQATRVLQFLKTLFTQMPIDCRSTDAKDLCEFIDTLPFKTQSSKVVKINRFAWSGHVYNLQTSTGWYATNHIITHNCRCKWVYVYHLRSLPPGMLTDKGREALKKVRAA